MKLQVFTLCLDSMPFLRHHLPVLEKSGLDFLWVIVHGVARNVGSTKWCTQIPPRLSADGSTEYLNSIKDHPNVIVLEREDWEGGKDQMVNAALEQFDEEGIAMQIDGDEIHTAEQLQKIVHLFDTLPYLGSIQFRCQYYCGPDIVLRGEGCYGSQWFEWLRAWRFVPGMRASRHEPPEMPKTGLMMGRDQSAELGLTFQHFAYATRQQANFKESYYNYPGATEGWERLQAQTSFPVKLKDFFPWVDDRVMAVRI